MVNVKVWELFPVVGCRALCVVFCGFFFVIFVLLPGLKTQPSGTVVQSGQLKLIGIEFKNFGSGAECEETGGV